MGGAALLPQVGDFVLDRYKAVVITVEARSTPATARFDIYDRTGAIIHSV